MRVCLCVRTGGLEVVVVVVGSWCAKLMLFIDLNGCDSRLGLQSISES